MSDQNTFESPQRQSFKGVFVLFFSDLLKNIRQNFIVLILPFINEKIRTDYLWIFLSVVAFLLILQFIYSYKSYLNYQFYIKKDALCLDYGVFKKSNFEIPFYRIQNINIEQSLLQKLLGVVGVKIDTAGGQNAEVKIKALSESKAENLKKQLIQIKKSLDANEEHVADQENKETNNSNKKVLQLGFLQLVKVGISSNFFKGIGIIFLVLTSTYDILSDLFNVFYNDDLNDEIYQSIPKTLSFTLFTLLFILILGFIITLISVVLKYFNLTVINRDEGFEVNYGLIKRENKFIKIIKTQIIEWETNPIKKWFGISNVYVSQASSGRVNQRQKIGIVGVNSFQFNKIFHTLFKTDVKHEFTIARTNVRYLLRLIWFQLIMASIFGLPAYFTVSPTIGLTVAIIVFIIVGLINYLTVIKSYIGYNPLFIKIGSGSIHTKYSYIPTYKIQSISIRQSILQRKSNLSDLIINTAAGTKKVNFIFYDKALAIMNRTNYDLHQTKDEWM
jgi:putative membrane protein